MLSSLRYISGCLRHTAACLITLAILTLPSVLQAEESLKALPAPTGQVLLKISGDLSLPNVGEEVHLDRQLLEAFPPASFVTHTPWSDKPQQFTGVRLSDLFKAIGANSSDFTASALDDYKFSSSGLDIDNYPIIIAYLEDENPISIRQLGPLRIMFPFTDHPELRTNLNESSAVWQLLEMTLP